MDDTNIGMVSIPNEMYVHLIEQNCRLETVMNYLRNDKYLSIETIFAILGESHPAKEDKKQAKANNESGKGKEYGDII